MKEHVDRRLYFIWKQILSRCTNPSNKDYKNYGGRGIKVCDRWLGENGFINFCLDMGERPPSYSVDRIDNNGDYSPTNCKWATYHKQAVNRRNNLDMVGVQFVKQTGSWRATLMVKRKRVLCKDFAHRNDAIAARRIAERKYL